MAGFARKNTRIKNKNLRVGEKRCAMPLRAFLLLVSKARAECEITAREDTAIIVASCNVLLAGAI